MVSDWRIELLEEPDLHFGDSGKAKDPRSGLLSHGPVPSSAQKSGDIVNVGIVGTSRTISMTEELLRRMRTGIESNTKRARWKHHFPGLGVDTELKLDYQTMDKWKGRIQPDQLESIRQMDDRNRRVEHSLNAFEYLIKGICKHTPPPDLIFVAIPEEIIEMCSDPDTQTDRIQTESGEDFHSRIKIAGMKHEPTQILTPKTLLRKSGMDVQEESEIAWNIAVGMLYKAREGRPWKLADFQSSTCYAGISFYKERGGDDPDTRASIAQVFIDDGEHFVIEGGTIDDAEAEEPQTHLTYDDAKRIAGDIIEAYGKRRDDHPNRLVLHKTSPFLDEETKGFSDGASDVSVKEFLSISKSHPLQLFTPGDNPPLRGTVAVPPGEREYYLYTTGYVPEQAVYNHSGAPNPLVIRPREDHFSGDYIRVCNEILKFTKLDWNSSDFCQGRPVTLSIADAVSNILAEPKASEIDLESHYYYYM